jgi:hypothetical protein
MNDASEVRWDFLLPKEFAAVIEACPACYMPLGTLERHGSTSLLPARQRS